LKRRQAEREWELFIDPDTVRLFASKARMLSAALNDDYEDGREHEIELTDDGKDSHHHDGLAEEEEDDLTEEEFRELVADLNLDEATDLLALALIGRGDFDVREIDEARAAAASRVNERLAGYLLSMPLLGNWLDEALEQIGA
jgi:hypothetical protein